MNDFEDIPMDDTIINDDGTETVYDSMVGTYSQSTSPFSSRLTRPYDAEIEVRIGVTSRVRKEGERFKETITYTEPFNYTTSTLKYGDDTPIMSTEAYAYMVSELNAGATVSVHVGVWMDNITHPPLGAGVVRLPKAHRDVAFTSQEITDEQYLANRINNIVLDFKNVALYN